MCPGERSTVVNIKKGLPKESDGLGQNDRSDGLYNGLNVSDPRRQLVSDRPQIRVGSRERKVHPIDSKHRKCPRVSKGSL